MGAMISTRLCNEAGRRSMDVDERGLMFADRFRKMMETLDQAAIEDIYDAGALIDVNVPTWRFQVQSLPAIIDQYAHWFPHLPPRVVALREWPAPFGAVLEMDMYETDGIGGQLYSRQLHVLFADGEKVSRHILYCTGSWDAETVERQRREAPMVEP